MSVLNAPLTSVPEAPSPRFTVPSSPTDTLGTLMLPLAYASGAERADWIPQTTGIAAAAKAYSRSLMNCLAVVIACTGNTCLSVWVSSGGFVAPQNRDSWLLGPLAPLACLNCSPGDKPPLLKLRLQLVEVVGHLESTLAHCCVYVPVVDDVRVDAEASTLQDRLELDVVRHLQ